MKKINREESSFRDPAGYIYYDKDSVYRRINKSYFDEFKYFCESGLYDKLIKNNLIVKHNIVKKDNDYIDLMVQKIPFISYPYEWSFDEYKDAATLTLKIERIALKYGMTLKDATAYNVQFLNGKPIFIDTTSFIFYKEGDPWYAYGQFCRHFICPIILMSKVDVRLNTLLKNYIDGIPLDLACNILGKRGDFFTFEHIKLHNKSIIKNENNYDYKKVNISKNSLLNMITIMEDKIKNIKTKKIKTEWDNYYNNTNYDSKALDSKEKIVNSFLKNIKFDSNDIIYDLGSNDGKYSIISSKYAYTISFDYDVNAVNRNYLNLNKNNSNMLPLVLDLFNPSPSIGFDLKERKSIKDRGQVKCIMALALIHHLIISNNATFDMVASSFKDICNYLIIEFVPKDDSKVDTLLKTRSNDFSFYNINNFENTFTKYFDIIEKENVSDSKRCIYLMRVKNEKDKRK